MSATPNAMQRVLRGRFRIFWLTWLVVTAAIISYLIKEVPPTYEAEAVLQVEPPSRSVFSPPESNVDLMPFMETQLQLLTSADVLNLALKDEKVAALRRVRTSLDPEADLKKKLHVSIPPRSHAIVISLSTGSPTDGALIVNAVVDAYTEISTSMADSSTKKLIQQYKQAKDAFRDDVERLRAEMSALSAEARNSHDQANPSDEALEQYKRYRERLSQVEMERIEAEAGLRVATESLRGLSDQATITDEALGKAIRTQFLGREDVVRLRKSLQDAQNAMAEAERTAKDPTDPALAEHRNRVAGLNSEFDLVWTKELPSLKALLLNDPGLTDMSREKQKYELALARLRAEESQLRKRLDEIKIVRNPDGGDVLKAEFLKADLIRANDSLKQVSLKLSALELESNGQASVSVLSPARPKPRPTSNPRPMLLAATPFASFALVLGLFTFAESIHGRPAASVEEAPTGG